MQPTILIPLATAIAYSIGALCLKRSTNDGVGPWRTTFFSNLMVGLLAAPFWFMGPALQSWTDLLMPLGLSVGFFLGQLFGCLAIHKGDVSVVTPLMGTKAVFVVFASLFIIGEDLRLAVWIGAFMTAVAVLLMRGEGKAERARLLPSILLGLASAACFAVTDVLTQLFGRSLGFNKLVASSFAFVALWSFLLVPLFRSPVSAISGKAWTWMLAGGAVLGAQAIGMGFVLSTYGDATTVNIVYSSRGFWSVLLVLAIGHWFSNREKHLGRAAMVRRLIGSILLLGAIVVIAIG